MKFLSYHNYPLLLECSVPLINFLIDTASASHPNSQTLMFMGLELSAFLVMMAEQQPQRFENLGHYTKNLTEESRFIDNLIGIMGN